MFKKIFLILGILLAVAVPATGFCIWVSGENVSWSTFALGVVILIVALVIFYVLNIDPIKSENKNIKNKISKVQENTDFTKNCIQDVFEAVRELQASGGGRKMHKLSPRSAADWANANSPLMLNEKGIFLLEKSEINKVVEANVEELIVRIKSTEPETAYDVQAVSFDVLGDFILDDNESEKRMKVFLYNNPKIKDKEIGLSDIIYVGALLLRDKYLEKYSDLR